eukprot:GILI01010088.1.p1 GENE.GILI01010088.1~~GILI01010088.1.p1  ORF type:complete len:333 (+),score=51.77 GILI01010088.1:56-1054(+)
MDISVPSDFVPETDAVAVSEAILENFVFERVINVSVKTKALFLLGRLPTPIPEDAAAPSQNPNDRAIIIAQKTQFRDEDIPVLCSGRTQLRCWLQNDVYSKYIAETDPSLHKLSLLIIHPATDRHLQKYSRQELYLFRETYDMYTRITLPMIKAIPAQRTEWVRNILEKKKEADRIIFEDPDPINGFVLLPDLKWDQVTLTEMYCLAICHKLDIGSLRDLTREHLPLLKNILQAGKRAICEKYKASPNQFRVFVHYLPSYYHFHVHFVGTTSDMVNALPGKGVLLEDIIDNIECFDSNYYQKKTMTIEVGENEYIFSQFVQAGYAPTPAGLT